MLFPLEQREPKEALSGAASELKDRHAFLYPVIGKDPVAEALLVGGIFAVQRNSDILESVVGTHMRKLKSLNITVRIKYLADKNTQNSHHHK